MVLIKKFILIGTNWYKLVHCSICIFEDLNDSKYSDWQCKYLLIVFVSQAKVLFPGSLCFITRNIKFIHFFTSFYKVRVLKVRFSIKINKSKAFAISNIRF